MKPTDPLLSRWQKILAKKGPRPAIFDRSGQALRTFQDIEDRAKNFESEIDQLVSAGGVLAVQIGNHEDWPSIFIACLRSEVIVLPLEQSISDHQRDAALKISNAAGVAFGDSRTGEARINLFPEKSTAKWDNDPPSLLKLTSGTTAAPRLIRFRSAQLLADCDQICETMGISDRELNFGVIPISHSYGFSNLLTPLIARGVPMVLSDDRTPRAVLSDLTRTGATVFPGMPVFYQAFCEIPDVPPILKLRLCISAGASLSLSVAKQFRAKFGLSIHSFYGASECGGICYDRDASSEIEGFVGAPMNGVELELIESDQHQSQVRVRSAAVGDRYFPETDPNKLGDGVFIPDDLLRRDDSGFTIVGRVSDVINVAGKKINPAEIEARLLQFEGIRQAVAFGRPVAGGLRNEEVVGCVVGNVTESEVLEFCRSKLSAWQVPKRIFVVERIPANERGKISRRELARQFPG